MSNYRIRIKVNFPVLMAHLTREEGRAVSQEQAERWLTEAGFVRCDGHWEVSEADLGQLEPSEVSEILPERQS